MKKEEFIKMAAIRYNVDRLIAFVNAGADEAKKVVVEYVKKNHKYGNAKRFEVRFEWSADGIAVGAIYDKGGMFSLDNEVGETGMDFRLTYKDVFGWDIEDWKKPTSTKSEANQLVFDTLSQIK